MKLRQKVWRGRFSERNSHVVCNCAATSVNGVGGHVARYWLVLSAQNAAAAAPTTGVVPAAADEVSALTATQFAAHAQMYQAVSAQATTIHECSSTPWAQLGVLCGHRGRQRGLGRLGTREMPIDFGAMPPEITSALLHAGPGPASLTTAASAWNELAAELNSAALGYDSVVTQLSSNERLGPASASMAAAVQPYVEWMNTTSIAAEHAATLAQAAAGAFETALASVVPPPLIAVNRAELAQALQANVFGQHNGLIAKLESQYSEFWAQTPPRCTTTQSVRDGPR